ncbi:ferrochelatase [bacterium BMS3Abin02]|nr:ferrochelatase [bacterium BMS3Abin02]GBE23089.1 ferrochelatase [bacterium BMS3Bbin01]
MVGVVLAQMGGPRDQAAVEPFIRAIFEDPDLVPIPGGPATSKVFGWLVAKIRGPFVRKNYRLIGGGSPILEITRHQARSLESVIGERDVDVAVAMRYTRPDTYDAVRELVRSGVDRLVLLPLYPQYSTATTGSSESELRRVMTELGVDLPLEVIRTWYDHPAYLDVQAALVSEAIERLPESDRDGVTVLFSAHGLPQRVADRGDPYPEETAATVAGVVQRLAYRIDARIGYQSRTRPVRWIGPGTDEVLRDLAAEGITTVVVVPISFVSDHFETLYETDILFRDTAKKEGIRRYIRADVMNDRPEVGPMLASILEDSL